jgi:uncharacterized membrane protein
MQNSWLQRFSHTVLVGLILAILIDIIWISMVSKKIYLAALSDIMLSPERMDPAQWAAAIAAWLVLVVGIVLLILPQTSDKKLPQAAGLGALYGLVVYGSYEFTNFAIFKYWPASIVAIDLAWGCAFCATLTIALTLLQGKLK